MSKPKTVTCMEVRFDLNSSTAEIAVSFWIGEKEHVGKHPARSLYVLERQPGADKMLRLRSYLSKFAELPFVYWWPGRDGCSTRDDAINKWQTLWDQPNDEETPLKVGCAGSLSQSNSTMLLDSAELLTFPGMHSLEPILDALDDTRRRYRLAMLHEGRTILDQRRKKVHEAAHTLWLAYAAARSKVTKTQADLDTMARAGEHLKQVLREQGLAASTLDLGAIPRVLILGESGSGKTLVANYLATRADPLKNDRQSRPMKRLAIPSFVNAEDRFEWDLFGYLPGAYTGARQEGSTGSAIQMIGGILFLDEIGEASAVLQAKMLAYMDDFEVCPRGWEGEGFTCPLLLVAATNRDVRKWAQQGLDGAESGNFRHDLYWRFDTVIDLPSLNSRKSEMAAIVDSMLQLNAINPGGKAITHYSYDVIQKLQDVDYKNSNFRLLTRLLKRAVKQAKSFGRKHLLARDIPDERIAP